MRSALGLFMLSAAVFAFALFALPEIKQAADVWQYVADAIGKVTP